MFLLVFLCIYSIKYSLCRREREKGKEERRGDGKEGGGEVIKYSLCRTRIFILIA